MVAIGPRRFDQTEDAPTELGSGSSIGEQNILPRNGNRSGHVFGLDIGDRQAAVITVALQRLGVIDQVLQRLTCAGMDHALALYLARPPCGTGDAHDRYPVPRSDRYAPDGTRLILTMCRAACVVGQSG